MGIGHDIGRLLTKRAFLDTLKGYAADAAAGDPSDSITPETIQSGFRDSSSELFTPENTKQQVKNMVSSKINPGAGGKTLEMSQADPSDPRGEMKAEIGSSVLSSLDTAVPQSPKWNLATGLGINLMGGGQTMGFLGNKAKNWGDELFKSSGLMKEIGQTVGKEFGPQTPAISQAADNVADIGQEGVDLAMKKNIGPGGNFMYQMLSGNFDFSDLDNTAGQTPTPNTGAASATPTPGI